MMYVKVTDSSGRTLAQWCVTDPCDAHGPDEVDAIRRHMEMRPDPKQEELRMLRNRVTQWIKNREKKDLDVTTLKDVRSFIMSEFHRGFNVEDLMR